MGAVIEMRGLTKEFGRTRAVDDLTCTIEPGVVTGFLGPNGAARAMADPQIGARMSLARPEAWRLVGAVGVYAALAAILAVGVAALLRHAAAAIAVLLLMPFVVQPLFGSLPRIGEHVGPLLPFANAYGFTGVPWIGSYGPSWGPLAPLAYFTAVVAVVCVAAVFAINRRDP